MNAHDIYSEWVHLANKGKKRAEFPLLTPRELQRLREYESGWIQNSVISTTSDKTIITLI